MLRNQAFLNSTMKITKKITQSIYSIVNIAAMQ